jgi:hypothetical protein
VVHQRGEVGGVGDHVGFAVQEPGRLLRQFGVKLRLAVGGDRGGGEHGALRA